MRAARDFDVIEFAGLFDEMPWASRAAVSSSLKQLTRTFYYITKLPMRLPVIKCHPSTKTKSKSLNGNEIKTGGNIIMPILIKTVDITMSIIRNGR